MKRAVGDAFAYLRGKGVVSHTTSERTLGLARVLPHHSLPAGVFQRTVVPLPQALLTPAAPAHHRHRNDHDLAAYAAVEHCAVLDVGVAATKHGRAGRRRCISCSGIFSLGRRFSRCRPLLRRRASLPALVAALFAVGVFIHGE